MIELSIGSKKRDDLGLERLCGGQVGICNNAVLTDGIQVGVINRSEELNYGQLGVINTACFAEACQIGLVNSCDDINGVQVGLLCRAENGKYVQLGLLTIRSGEKPWYKRVTPIFGYHKDD